MQRALGGAENSGPPTLKAQPQPKDSVPSQNPAKKDTLHSKQMPSSASQPTKPTEGQKLSSQSSTSATHPSQQTSQQKPLPHQTTKGAPPAKTEIPSKTEPPKKEEESSFFGFGFGGARSRSPSPQPGASSVSGKVLGFGSSFLSSASNLISAVQDEPSTTPPTKGSTVSQTSAKNTTPPSSRKGSEASKGSPNVPKSQTQEGKRQQQQNKPQDTQKTTTTKESSSAQATKLDQSPKLLPKACPLCKASLRRDPPNYSTCTECKATVCNQCGFNPVPHQTEVKEWLCLNCQMQRALGGAENSGPPTLKAQPQPKDSVPSQNPAKKDTLHSKQMPSSASQPTKPTEGQKLSSQSSTSATHPSQQTSQQKPLPHQTTKGAPPAKTEIPSKTEPPKKEEESSFFGFGFGGARSRSPSPQPGASSVSGKVLGFGSSFLSSASNLISAVQDEPSTTPPTKGSTVSQTSAKNTTPPSSRKGSEASKGSPNVPKSQTQEGKRQQQQNKPQDTQKTTTTKESSSAQATKLDQSPKLLPKACPLCKASLRRDPPNYSTCTECKATVCNQCGFNPVPHQTEVRNR
uniref:Zinc finger piccolo-type domain-containing protein n=1 Tax=Sinocyclocheilus anshuiensis TaxID=1608454 RepID=A0A671RZ59_9TELE